MPLTLVQAEAEAFEQRERRQSCWRRLAAQYGSARADLIMAGQDRASNADELAWQRLGQGREH